MGKEYVLHIYNGIIIIIKKNNMSFLATWVDVDIISSDVSHDEKDKYHMISLTCETKYDTNYL